MKHKENSWSQSAYLPRDQNAKMGIISQRRQRKWVLGDGADIDTTLTCRAERLCGVRSMDAVSPVGINGERCIIGLVSFVIKKFG